MSDWTFLEQHRVQIPGYPVTDASWGFCGAFRFNLAGEVRPIHVIASDGDGWQHVSVSFGNDAKRCPPWEIMCAVKDLFCEAEDSVIQIHPAASKYVNRHPGCLHLWRCLDGREQPLPPLYMV